MGIFKSWGASLIRPYTRMIKDVTSSVRGIKKSLEQVKANKGSMASDDYIDAPNSRTAFEALVEKNGWTPDGLKVQLRAVSRIKWVSFALLWFFVCGFFTIGFYADGVFMALCGCILCMFAVFFCAVRVFQFSVFQTQLRERNLIGAKDFFGRQDFWTLLFS